MEPRTRFNACGSWFSVCTARFTRIYATTQPTKIIKNFKKKYVLFAPLDNTQYAAAVPQTRPNTLLLLDNQLDRLFCQITFTDPITFAHLTRHRIIVTLPTTVFIYSFTNPPKKLYTFDTIETHLALSSVITPSPDALVLAIPGRNTGQIQIISFPSLSAKPITSLIQAHHAPPSCISLSPNGKLLASASITGTLIRIFDGEAGWIKRGEFRRGVDQADVFGISFSAAGDKICVVSDKGTVHIFNIYLRNRDLGNLSPYLPKYFASQWSFAQFSLPVECKCVCAFVESGRKGGRSEVVIVCGDGSVYFCSFDDAVGGELRKDYFERLDFGNSDATTGSQRTRKGKEKATLPAESLKEQHLKEQHLKVAMYHVERNDVKIPPQIMPEPKEKHEQVLIQLEELMKHVGIEREKTSTNKQQEQPKLSEENQVSTELEKQVETKEKIKHVELVQLVGESNHPGKPFEDHDKVVPQKETVEEEETFRNPEKLVH